VAPSIQAVLVEDVAFSYRAGREVLRIPAFQIERGEHVFLFGPSGSGKTTLLGLIAGVLRVTQGTLRVLDRDFTKLSNHKRDSLRGSHMGYIFQLFNLITYLNVIDNITLPCRLHRARRMRLDGRDLKSAAAQVASHLGIETLLAEDVSSLSVGQQQRVAAARALLGSPELVIADEPTSSLDVDHRERFIRLLFESCRQAGSTLIFVSHDHGLAPLFDRTVSLTEINAAPVAGS
jgi:putative ABC transport system ATP-binding protein